MTAPSKPEPKPTPPSDQNQEAPPGPTGPAGTNEGKRKGPETGGYDDHSPDRARSNAKGGYGAG